MIIGNIPDNVSHTHKTVALLLEQLKPFHRIYSEYPLVNLVDSDFNKAKISKYRLDFYDETFGLAIEIQGVQHSKFVRFFHKDAGGFDRQVISDRMTRIVCNLHNIKLVTITTEEELSLDIVRSWYE